jgi:hypothetical protein
VRDDGIKKVRPQIETEPAFQNRYKKERYYTIFLRKASMSLTVASDLHGVIYKYLIQCGYAKSAKHFLREINRPAEEIETSDDILEIWSKFYHKLKRTRCVDDIPPAGKVEEEEEAIKPSKKKSKSALETVETIAKPLKDKKKKQPVESDDDEASAKIAKNKKDVDKTSALKAKQTHSSSAVVTAGAVKRITAPIAAASVKTAIHSRDSSSDESDSIVVLKKRSSKQKAAQSSSKDSSSDSSETESSEDSSDDDNDDDSDSSDSSSDSESSSSSEDEAAAQAAAAARAAEKRAESKRKAESAARAAEEWMKVSE